MFCRMENGEKSYVLCFYSFLVYFNGGKWYIFIRVGLTWNNLTCECNTKLFSTLDDRIWTDTINHRASVTDNPFHHLLVPKNCCGPRSKWCLSAQISVAKRYILNFILKKILPNGKIKWCFDQWRTTNPNEICL